MSTWWASAKTWLLVFGAAFNTSNHARSLCMKFELWWDEIFVTFFLFDFLFNIPRRTKKKERKGFQNTKRQRWNTTQSLAIKSQIRILSSVKQSWTLVRICWVAIAQFLPIALLWRNIAINLDWLLISYRALYNPRNNNDNFLSNIQPCLPAMGRWGKMVERLQGVKYSQWEGGNGFLDIFYGQGKLILQPAAFFSTTRSGLSLAR